MKKLIFLMVSALIVALAGATFSSCGDETVKPWSKAAIEEISTESASAVCFDLANPTFVNVDEVVANQQTSIEKLSIDSAFNTMPVTVLKNVASVCIGKSGTCNKRQIIEEYNRNKAVYTNLPEPSTTSKANATDSGGLDVTKEEPFSTEYSYYTDTVEGKPVKIRVKTEKSYTKLTMEPRAIVIVWNGKAVDDEVIANMMANMVATGAAVRELIEVKQLDSKGLAKCLAKSFAAEEIPENNDIDPIYQSIVFIGEKYKGCDISSFALKLSADLSMEAYKRSTGKPCDLALISAVEILATKTVTYQKYKKCMAENEVTKDMLRVINQAYLYHNIRHVS